MSEWSAVQSPMIEYAAQIGWEKVTPGQAETLRGGVDGLYFTDVLTAQLAHLNPGVLDNDDARLHDVLRRLRSLKPTIEGNRDALKWLRGKMSVYVAEEKRERNVRLIDFDSLGANSLDANVYHVTWEWKQKPASYPAPNRADVMFLINGLPVAVVELKAAAKSNGLAEGIDQIRRYHRETPEMMTLPQVFDVSEMLRLWYGATWSLSRKNLLDWKDEETGNPDSNANTGNYEKKVKAFFDRERVLRVLKEYVVFLSTDDVLSKVILRQHQIRAVEKVVKRAQDPAKRRALI